MRGKNFIQSQIAALQAAVNFFSPGNKPARERWVVESFLKNLEVSFTQQDVRSVDDDPPDVLFRDARFEVKEVLDKGRRRHHEFKEDLKKAKNASSTKDFLRSYTPTESSLQEFYDRCLAEAQKLDAKYPRAVRGSIDLLFYVNFQRIEDVREIPYPDTTQMAQHGWRSVSMVNGHSSSCFVADQNAPEFIQRARDAVFHRSNP